MSAYLDRECNRLGIGHGRRESMQPAEIFDLVEGDRQQWNRVATLGAWIAWFVSMSIPRLSSSHSWRDECQRFDKFLEMFPPPGLLPTDQTTPPRPTRRRR